MRQQKIFTYLLYGYLLFCGLVSWFALPLLSLSVLSNLSVIEAWVGTLTLIIVAYQAQQKASSYLGLVIFFLSYHVFGLFQPVAQYLPYRFDSVLVDLDRQIFGKSLPLYFQEGSAQVPSYLSVWVSEFFATCYLYLFFLQIGSFLYWRKNANIATLQQFNLGILALFFLGFISYFILPAKGPYLAYPAIFHYPPHGRWMTDFLVATNQKLSVGMDVFPSLHVAFAVFIGGFYFAKRRWLLGGLLLPFNLGLIMATQYFSYHYGVDILAGAVLALAVLWVVTGLGKE